MYPRNVFLINFEGVPSVLSMKGRGCLILPDNTHVRSNFIFKGSVYVTLGSFSTSLLTLRHTQFFLMILKLFCVFAIHLVH